MFEDINNIPESKSELESRLAVIDDLINLQLNEILHHPEFKELEAAWRGLHYLVTQSDFKISKDDHLSYFSNLNYLGKDTTRIVRVKILNVGKKELLKDFEKTVEFKQSTLFQKVFEGVYSNYQAAPFGLLIGSYEFSNHPQDISLLEQISQVAAFAHAPFISGVSPEMFGWKFFGDMIDVRDIAKIFEKENYYRWRCFRESETSCYVGLCLPHFLLRDPHLLTTPFSFRESIYQEEELHWTEKTNLLWGNAAFVFGARVAQAYNEKSWLGKMGIEGDGLVEGLYFEASDTDGAGSSFDAIFNDRRVNEFSDQGFIPLQYLRGWFGAGVFRKCLSVHKPKKFDSDAANNNAQASVQLDYIIAVSRFALYLMCLERDRSGCFMSRSEMEIFLNRWISQYVTTNDNATEREKAQQPLREARVNVSQIPGRPEQYRAVIYLRPVCQLEGLPIAMRIVVDLPGQAH